MMRESKFLKKKTIPTGDDLKSIVRKCLDVDLVNEYKKCPFPQMLFWNWVDVTGNVHDWTLERNVKIYS